MHRPTPGAFVLAIRPRKSSASAAVITAWWNITPTGCPARTASATTLEVVPCASSSGCVSAAGWSRPSELFPLSAGRCGRCRALVTVMLAPRLTVMVAGVNSRSPMLGRRLGRRKRPAAWPTPRW